MIEFITRDACPLCDEGWTSIESVTRRLRVPVSVRDVDTDASLAIYRDRLPVVLDDGAVVLEGRWSRWQAYRAILRSRF